MADPIKPPSIHRERCVVIHKSRRYQRLPNTNIKEPLTYPWLKLSGKWLETAGFKADLEVKVIVRNGKIVITPMTKAHR
ncbi:SymE family type I addiction module toxin [Paraburkholderia bonniea]|nr:SymE family type I addiction module toxin [Paraburkholderia bonniea]